MTSFFAKSLALFGLLTLVACSNGGGSTSTSGPATTSTSGSGSTGGTTGTAASSASSTGSGGASTGGGSSAGSSSGASGSGTSGGGGTTGAADAGPCLQDSQCPGSYYCDFTVAHCPTGGNPSVGTVLPGNCLPIVTTAPSTCVSGEDCPTGLECAGPSGSTYNNDYDFCTLEAPCDAGTCSALPCPPEPGQAG